VQLVSDDSTKATYINIDNTIDKFSTTRFIRANSPTLGQVVGLDETQNYTLNYKDFVDAHQVEKSFNRNEQIKGLKQLLAFLQNDPRLDLSKDQHIRWAAYILATTYHETWFTWNSIQENYNPPSPWHYFENKYGGRGDLDNDPYGLGDGFRYRGRGYVQLTGKYNYDRFGKAFGMNFVDSGDTNQILGPTVAYTIMSYGMRRGLYRDYNESEKGMEYYISDGKGLTEEQKRQEYINARSIVNPDDKAEEIADDTMQIEDILTNSPMHHINSGGRYYIENGSYKSGSMRGWSVSGTGVIDTLPFAGDSHWARVTAASPVVLSQSLTTPVGHFTLSFDYQFTTITGTLDVMLNSVVLVTLDSPNTVQNEPNMLSVSVSEVDLLGYEDAVLAFRFDGPTDSQILLSNINIYIPQAIGYSIGDSLTQRSAVGELRIRFNSDVSANLRLQNLLLQNHDTCYIVDANSIAVDYNEATNTSVWTFPGLADGLLPEGNYRAYLVADGLFDAAGTPVLSDYYFTFHVLGGDATGNGQINLLDFAVVGQSYLNEPNDPYYNHNADLTGNRQVDLSDVATIADNYLRAKREVLPADIMCPSGVNFKDFAFFSSYWQNEDCVETNWCGRTDFNHSGAVDFADLAELAEYWLWQQD
jgi:hypothetical protein